MYDLQPVNLNYFHKFFQRLFHMVQNRRPLIFDHEMLPTFKRINYEMAPKSEFKLLLYWNVLKEHY